MDDNSNQFRHPSGEPVRPVEPVRPTEPTPTGIAEDPKDQVIQETVVVEEKVDETTAPKERTRLNTFLTPLILGLGLLLLVGSLVIGLRNRNQPEVVTLEDYSPAITSPTVSTSPSDDATVAVGTQAPAAQSGTAQAPTTKKVATPVATPKTVQIAAEPQVKGTTTTKVAPAKKTTMTTAAKPASTPAPTTPEYSASSSTSNSSTSTLPEYQASSVSYPEYTPQHVDVVTVTLSVSGRNYSATVPTGSKVIDVMRKLTEQGLTYKTKSFSFGEQIIEINGQAQEEGKNYWTYMINGKFATQGISTQTVNQGDIITWTLSAAQ